MSDANFIHRIWSPTTTLISLLHRMCQILHFHFVQYIWSFDFNLFVTTRSYAALQAADLYWIIGPGYSSGGYILGENHEKPTWNHEKPGITSCDKHAASTDLWNEKVLIFRD